MISRRMHHALSSPLHRNLRLLNLHLPRRPSLIRSLATTTAPPPRPPRPSVFPSSTPSPLPPPSSQEIAQRAQQAVAEALALSEQKARTLRNKNVALGLLMVGFVVWSYFNSIRSVRTAADSLVGTDVAEIERELDSEEKLSEAKTERATM